MDWTNLVAALDQLSLFDLGCFERAIQSLSQDPARIARARSYLRPGIEVEYWCEKDHTFIKAVVVELHRSTALLEHVGDCQRWKVYYSQIVPPDASPLLPPASSLPKSEWRAGDLVSFKDKQNREHLGTIEKINPRRAHVRLKSGQIWRVDYALLARIHELRGQDHLDYPHSSEYEGS